MLFHSKHQICCYIPKTFHHVLLQFSVYFSSSFSVSLLTTILRSKKGSLPSLIAGYTFAILYAAAGYLSMKSNNDKNNGNANLLGIKIALGSSVVLTLVGAKRSYLTRFESNVPIMLFFLGLLATGYYVFKQVQL